MRRPLHWTLIVLAVLGAGFAGLAHMILGFFVVLWFWQVRTGHNPIGEGESPAEFMLCGLWVLVPVAGIVWWLRDSDRPDLRPGAVAAWSAGIGVAELAAAWWVIKEI